MVTTCLVVSLPFSAIKYKYLFYVKMKICPTCGQLHKDIFNSMKINMFGWVLAHLNEIYYCTQKKKVKWCNIIWSCHSITKRLLPKRLLLLSL